MQNTKGLTSSSLVIAAKAAIQAELENGQSVAAQLGRVAASITELVGHLCGDRCVKKPAANKDEEANGVTDKG